VGECLTTSIANYFCRSKNGWTPCAIKIRIGLRFFVEQVPFSTACCHTLQQIPGSREFLAAYHYKLIQNSGIHFVTLSRNSCFHSFEACFETMNRTNWRMLASMWFAIRESWKKESLSHHAIFFMHLNITQHPECQLNLGCIFAFLDCQMSISNRSSHICPLFIHAALLAQSTLDAKLIKRLGVWITSNGRGTLWRSTKATCSSLSS